MGLLPVTERAGGQAVEDAASANARLGNSDPEGFNSLDPLRAADPSPWLSILIREPWCAIHYARTPDGPISTLQNPSPDDTPEEVRFRYVEGVAPFTRPYIHPLSTAPRYIEEFAADAMVGSVPSGNWIEL
jgi:hypothetical protein